MKLEVKGISKYYGHKAALQKIDLTLVNGVYGLVGPNGAGKTTLINILVNVLNASEGEVRYDEKPILLHMEEYLGYVGYLPQYPKFYGDFTCIEFLRYMCVLKDIPKKEREKKIEEVLHICNLTENKNKKIRAFSGGMRQRLGIAQAILNDPKLLILDEPTAGLDPKERIRFRNVISNLSNDRIVILATHIMEDVESIAQKVILIAGGKLIGFKDTRDMLEEIRGKVWQKAIDQKELNRYDRKYIISNIIHEHDKIIIRYISDEKQEEAQVVEPKLEEVYLHYFGEVEHASICI